MSADNLSASLAYWDRIKGYRDQALPSARALFENDENRFTKYAFQHDGLLLDLSKNPVPDDGFQTLIDFAESRDIVKWRDRMFGGDKINTTEDRAALHTALRAPDGPQLLVDGEDVRAKVRAALAQMRAFTVSLRGGIWSGATGAPITDIVNIGIGGSDLGPAMATQALKAFHKNGLNFHFISNIDGTASTDILDQLEPASTLFIIASKTFTTTETMANAELARHWLQQSLGPDAVAKHCVAVSANREAVIDFGIDAANMFPLWDWVGGRYSVWSAIGLSLAIAIGMDEFEAFLAGAASMDQHFLSEPLSRNMPVLLALIGIWNQTVLHCGAHAVLPYSHRLGRFPAYLQQLEMESNGKGVTMNGGDLSFGSGSVIFGEPGTNAQHAFMQLLHQGPNPISTDFISIIEPELEAPRGQHTMLLANALAQGEALMRGQTLEEAKLSLEKDGVSDPVIDRLTPHKVFPGSRPVTTILLDQLKPYSLGLLMALYEHKTFVQGVLWGVNAFDQWGVELGKTLAKPIVQELTGDVSVSDQHDASTQALIAHIRTRGY